jgi:hypothetical protein
MMESPRDEHVLEIMAAAALCSLPLGESLDEMVLEKS